MKLWIDDVRPAPEGYIWARSTNEAINIIKGYDELTDDLAGLIKEPLTLPWFDIISLDHDAGDYVSEGGDYIKVLDFLEEHFPNIKCAFHIHSMNPVGVANMRAIIKRNGWTEVI